LWCIAAAVIAVTTGAYVYDEARGDEIAQGVRISGVDVGGMTADDAEAAIQAHVGRTLAAPVVAEHDGRRFELAPEAAALNADVRGAVDAALARSRKGNFLSRTARSLAGAELDAEIELRASHSRQAVRDFVHRIEHVVERRPRDARVSFSRRGPKRVRARAGLVVRVDALERAVSRALGDVHSSRRIAVRTAVARPELATSDLADRYPWVITIDRRSFELRLFRRLRRVKTYAVGIGRVGYSTPKGLYRIQNKAVNPPWNVPDEPWAGRLRGKVIPPGPDNPIKARWLGIVDGAGIHGTAEEASIGTRASHGCIRMRIPEVKQLYRRVPVGTPVYVA
jgi:hypothetical protein